MMEFNSFYSQKKQQLDSQHQYRNLKQSRGLDFCSNDYLGFSTSDEIKSQYLAKLAKYPLGSTGSRLIRGQNPVIDELEDQLAVQAQAPSALLFPSGYQANLALLSAVLKDQAVVYSDELNHASIIDGIRLSRCEKKIFRHNDLNHLQELLAGSDHQKLRFVVVESLYSMQGDFAPIKGLCDLCEQFSAHLIVDEAHATGLFGKNGSGCVEELGLSERVFARVHTAGKALGAAGAWVTGSHELKDFLVNFSRPFIYSTGPSYPQVLLIASAIDYWQREGYQGAKDNLDRVQSLRQDLKVAQEYGVQVVDSPGPIISYRVGQNQKALEISQSLFRQGYDVRAIRPPTVPADQAMLRITVPGQRRASEINSFKKTLLSVSKGIEL